MILQGGYSMYLRARRACKSLDAIFDEDFTSPVSMSDLSFQGAMKLRNIKGWSNIKHSEPIIEEAGPVY